MTMTDTYLYELLNVLFILRDYLPNVILIGGCVPYIYSRYMFGSNLPPVYTKDLDILASNEVPILKESIVSLLVNAGYKGRVLKIDQNQFFKFESRSATGFEVEFLTTEPTKMHGESMVIQSGLRAQILPGLDLLLVHNTEVKIRDKIDGKTIDIKVHVPTPGAFVLNKINSYLKPYGNIERNKDIYYVFYMLRYLPIGKQDIADSIRRCIGTRELKTLISAIRPLFSEEYSLGTLDVAAQLSGLDMTASNIRLLILSDFNEFIDILGS